MWTDQTSTNTVQVVDACMGMQAIPDVLQRKSDIMTDGRGVIVAEPKPMEGMRVWVAGANVGSTIYHNGWRGIPGNVSLLGLDFFQAASAEVHYNYRDNALKNPSEFNKDPIRAYIEVEAHTDESREEVSPGIC